LPGVKGTFAENMIFMQKTACENSFEVVNYMSSIVQLTFFPFFAAKKQIEE
jgi:hypothetical protein